MFYNVVYKTQYVLYFSVSDEADGYQALKDDLTILKHIDELRRQLKSSYSVSC